VFCETFSLSSIFFFLLISGTEIFTPNIILTIHTKNIKTIIGITHDVINNTAIASINLLNSFSPLFTNSETFSPKLDTLFLNLDKNPLSSLLSFDSVFVLSFDVISVFLAFSIVSLYVFSIKLLV